MYNSWNVFFRFRHFTANIVCLVPAVERPKTGIKSKGVRRRVSGGALKYRRRKGSSCPPSCQLDQTKKSYRNQAENLYTREYNGNPSPQAPSDYTHKGDYQDSCDCCNLNGPLWNVAWRDITSSCMPKKPVEVFCEYEANNGISPFR
jgi:hypothetical protein